jgi:hypothetical protein
MEEKSKPAGMHTLNQCLAEDSTTAQCAILPSEAATCELSKLSHPSGLACPSEFEARKLLQQRRAKMASM